MGVDRPRCASQVDAGHSTRMNGTLGGRKPDEHHTRVSIQARRPSGGQNDDPTRDVFRSQSQISDHTHQKEHRA